VRQCAKFQGAGWTWAVFTRVYVKSCNLLYRLSPGISGYSLVIVQKSVELGAYLFILNLDNLHYRDRRNSVSDYVQRATSNVCMARRSRGTHEIQ
jgi:hypothetical protein